MDKQSSVDTIKNITRIFNEAVRRWEDATGHRVHFSWSFDGEGRKVLRTQQVVEIVYTEPASHEDMEEIIAELQASVEQTFTIPKEATSEND